MQQPEQGPSKSGRISSSVSTQKTQQRLARELGAVSGTTMRRMRWIGPDCDSHAAQTKKKEAECACALGLVSHTSV